MHFCFCNKVLYCYLMTHIQKFENLTRYNLKIKEKALLKQGILFVISYPYSCQNQVVLKVEKKTKENEKKRNSSSKAHLYFLTILVDGSTFPLAS